MTETRAATFSEFGSLNNIKIGSVDLPEVGEGEVLIEVKAAGVNPVDAGIVGGHLKGRVPHNFPIIPGWDLAGVVKERGFSARRFGEGDEVYAYARRPIIQWGTFAEHIVIPESYLAAKPANLDFEEAGAVPLTVLTAYQSLYDAGNLADGQTVAILGASGGVGSFGIQLAKVKNARVIGVASEKNHEFMEELGADETIDYQNTDVGKTIRDIEPGGVDLIFDCTSGETLRQALPTLKDDGKLVSIVNHGDNIDPSIDFEYVFVEPNSRELDDLCSLAEEGDLKVHISQTFPLEQTRKALQQIQTLHTTGKIVIKP